MPDLGLLSDIHSIAAIELAVFTLYSSLFTSLTLFTKSLIRIYRPEIAKPA